MITFGSYDTYELVELVTLLQNCSKTADNGIADPVSYWYVIQWCISLSIFFISRWTSCCFLIMNEFGEYPISDNMKSDLREILGKFS